MPKPETTVSIDFSSILGALFFTWVLQLLFPRRVVEQLLAESSSSHAIICDSLKKVFPARDGNPEKFAVQGLSLAIPRGECFGMLGPNGAGKTSFINMVSSNMSKPFTVLHQNNAVQESLKSVNLFHGGVADKQAGKYSGALRAIHAPDLRQNFLALDRNHTRGILTPACGILTPAHRISNRRLGSRAPDSSRSAGGAGRPRSPWPPTARPAGNSPNPKGPAAHSPLAAYDVAGQEAPAGQAADRPLLLASYG
ncbi:ABC transporter A family member 7 [Platanthera guangdongensis]|uniref:ABC transporter A family member 7 n=1 Tax=Platanthera guangdongensis TaxID=2320717 RepID=A0ABR2LI03_9ASPA